MPNLSQVAIEQLKTIPFLNFENLNGRVIPSLSFYDGEQWHLWVPTPNGLLPLKAEPAEADYFGRVAESESDVYLEFLNFITQRAYWPKVAFLIDGSIFGELVVGEVSLTFKGSF